MSFVGSAKSVSSAVGTGYSVERVAVEQVAYFSAFIDLSKYS